MGLQLNSDGTATITWQAKGEAHSVLLAGPTLGQLAEIMDNLDRVWEDLDAITTERERIREETRIAAGMDEDGNMDGDADLDALRRLRKDSNALEIQGRQIGSSRFVEVVRMLGEGPDVEVFAEDPPAWSHSLVGINRLIGHFNSVPFGGPVSHDSNETGKTPPADTNS